MEDIELDNEGMEDCLLGVVLVVISEVVREGVGVGGPYIGPCL